MQESFGTNVETPIGEHWVVSAHPTATSVVANGPLAGTILIEIQETSDVTYRVYDWDRVDANGRARELHIEKAADVMMYGEPPALAGTDMSRRTLFESERVRHEHMLTCPYFAIEKVTVAQDACQMRAGRPGNPYILIVANGEGTLHAGAGTEPLDLRFDDTVLIPGTLSGYRIETNSQIELLKTYY